MYIFGGQNNSPPFNDVWGYDLVTGTWTEVFPTTSALPPARQCAASVLVGSKVRIFVGSQSLGALQWFINGGQDVNGNALHDTWYSVELAVTYCDCFRMIDLNSAAWTSVTTLDTDSILPVPTMMHRGVLSPYDQLVLSLSRFVDVKCCRSFGGWAIRNFKLSCSRPVSMTSPFHKAAVMLHASSTNPRPVNL